MPNVLLLLCLLALTRFQRCVGHSPVPLFPSPPFRFLSFLLPVPSPSSTPSCPLFPSREAVYASRHVYSPGKRCPNCSGRRSADKRILVNISSKFSHFVTLLTACSAVEACRKSIGNGKFQIIIPFLEGTRLLASPSAQTLGERVPPVPNGLMSCLYPTLYNNSGQVLHTCFLSSAVKFVTDRKTMASAAGYVTVLAPRPRLCTIVNPPTDSTFKRVS